MNLVRRVAVPKVVGSGRLSILQNEVQHLHHKQEAQAGEGNITRQNFWRSLEGFKAHLRSADFVGFDLELSGIHSVLPVDSSCLDLESPLQRSYRRIKHLAEKFAVFQVGFALFHFDPVCNRILAYPYNFYVFPRNDLSLGLPATTLSCEASALEFLASHGFDFNLCIKDGISYLSKTQEGEAKALLANELCPFRLKTCTCSKTLSNISDIVFAERLRVDIEKWHNSISACNAGLVLPSRDLAADFFALSRGQIKDFELPSSGILNKYPSFTLQLENHHQVCLAQMVIEKHFRDLVPAVRSDCVSSSSHDVKVLFTQSKEDLVIVKRELEQGGEQTDINEAVGFRHIVDAVVSSGKPLIGHNCALDLAHIHSKFLSPLPSSVEEFAASLRSNFPCIIDTKCLIKFEPSLRTSWASRNTSLNTVYSRMFKLKNIASGNSRFTEDYKQSQRVHIDIMDGFKRYQDTGTKLLHEAGYDAFMTGCVFAQICQQLHVNVKDLFPAVHDISKFINLLNLGRGILDLHTGKLRETDGFKKDLDQVCVYLAQMERQCVEG